jgi:hypothetical protein
MWICKTRSWCLLIKIIISNSPYRGRQFFKDFMQHKLQTLHELSDTELVQFEMDPIWCPWADSNCPF